MSVLKEKGAGWSRRDDSPWPCYIAILPFLVALILRHGCVAVLCPFLVVVVGVCVRCNWPLTVRYTVDRAPEVWAYSAGHINDKMIAEHLPSPTDDGNPLILMCGCVHCHPGSRLSRSR